ATPILDEIERWPCDLIVVDMLDTPESDMRRLAETGIPLLTMDDRGPGRVWASEIINILVTEPERERLPKNVGLLEGGDYVTLDTIFAEAHRSPVKREFGPLKNVFVTLGGADAAGLSLKVADALQ